MDNPIDELIQASKAEAECFDGDKKTAAKQRLLNWCTLVFTAVLTVVSIVVFFILLARGDGTSAGVVASYVLSMLLAAPTLKVFLDKVKCPVLRKANVIGLVTVFSTILVLSVASLISFVA